VRNALVECSRTAGTTSSFKYRMTSLHSFSIRSATSPSALFVRVDRSSLLLFFIASLFHELGVWISPVDRPAAIAACLIVLSIPMIQFQAFSAYVDLLGSAGIRAAFALLLGRRSKIVEQTLVPSRLPCWPVESASEPNRSTIFTPLCSVYLLLP